MKAAIKKSTFLKKFHFGTLEQKESDSKINIIIAIILVQFIVTGVLLLLLNSKINRLTEGTEQNFSYTRQMLNQISSRIYQLQVDVRKRVR